MAAPSFDSRPPDDSSAAHAGTHDDREPPPDRHAQEVEQREAYEYWGYLFKPDKTGTNQLKTLLRGLKDHMTAQYEPSDQPDLTPAQLAHFYRDLHGNYDQLFLGTPHESIAFIYKSLGCLHSLQPLHHTHAIAFSDPTVPCLKTEGWIVWQTIQLLLGPEEHSAFLREAVRKWDVRDATTGDILPKILPRECFPMEPDSHMVAWYEGVSDRLRREAEDEERQRQIEAAPKHKETNGGRAREKQRARADEPTNRDDDDEAGSVDSRGPALAYFRDPLYRHNDGRPSIAQRNSKRLSGSPRPSSGSDQNNRSNSRSRLSNIVRNVGSPHLWDGGRSSRSGSRDRKRRSVPDAAADYRLRHGGGGDGAPSPDMSDARASPRPQAVDTLPHRRRRSMRSAGGSEADDSGERDGANISRRESPAIPNAHRSSSSGSNRHRPQRPGNVPRVQEPSPTAPQPQPQPQAQAQAQAQAPAQQQQQQPHPSRSRSRSRDPDPVEGADYFGGYDDAPSRKAPDLKSRMPSGQDPANRENMPPGGGHHDDGDGPHRNDDNFDNDNEQVDDNPDTNPQNDAGGNGDGYSAQGPSDTYHNPTAPHLGPSFGPSASPLFASHVARQPPSKSRQQNAPPPPRSHRDDRPPPRSDYDDRPPPRNDYDDRLSPRSHDRPPPRNDPYDNRPPSRNDPYNRPPPRNSSAHRQRYPSRSPDTSRYRDDPPPPSRSRHDRSRSRHDRSRSQDQYDPPRHRRQSGPPSPRDRPPRDRRSDNRRSVDGGSGYYSPADDDMDGDPGPPPSRRAPRKQTRFADTGVGGRRYPSESPYRGDGRRD